MKIKRIKTLTRPSTDILWESDWAINNPELNAERQAYVQSQVSSGLISFVSNSESDDGLTTHTEMHFDSVNNFVTFLSEGSTYDLNNGYAESELNHWVDNNITHSQTFIYEK